MLVCTAAPFWAEKPTSQDVAENDHVTFRCRGNGIPEPRIQWLINGVPLTRTFALQKTTLLWLAIISSYINRFR